MTLNLSDQFKDFWRFTILQCGLTRKILQAGIETRPSYTRELNAQKLYFIWSRTESSKTILHLTKNWILKNYTSFDQELNPQKLYFIWARTDSSKTILHLTKNWILKNYTSFDQELNPQKLYFIWRRTESSKTILHLTKNWTLKNYISQIYLAIHLIWIIVYSCTLTLLKINYNQLQLDWSIVTPLCCYFFKDVAHINAILKDKYISWMQNNMVSNNLNTIKWFQVFLTSIILFNNDNHLFVHN